MVIEVFGGIAVIKSDEILICDASSALDMVMSVQHEKNCSGAILYKHNICEEFFDLRTGIAGDILQKFVTYKTKLAIIGDFSCYQSKALQDFIFESNKGNHIYFSDSIDDALKKLA